MHRSHSQTGGSNIPLSALGGGEGRGEVGEPPSRTAELPTSPSRRSHAGPLPLPPQAGGEGQGGRGPMSRSAASPTSPSHASGVGPSLSPRKGGEGVFGRFLPVTRCSN